MFVNDHLQNFPYSNLPAFCVGLADDYDAPSAGGGAFMRIPPRKLRGDRATAMALLEAGLDEGFDFAYSYEIESWDELSVPLHFLTPDGDIPIVPVYTNCAAPPLPRIPAPLRPWASATLRPPATGRPSTSSSSTTSPPISSRSRRCCRGWGRT